MCLFQVIIKVYVSDKNFEPKKVAKASQAAEGLCKWVRAMVLYDKVIKVVAPKKLKLAAAEKSFEDTMKFLEEKRRMLADLNEKLAKLNEQLSETVAKKLDLENEVLICGNKLVRAEKLIRYAFFLHKILRTIANNFFVHTVVSVAKSPGGPSALKIYRSCTTVYRVTCSYPAG